MTSDGAGPAEPIPSNVWERIIDLPPAIAELVEAELHDFTGRYSVFESFSRLADAYRSASSEMDRIVEMYDKDSNLDALKDNNIMVSNALFDMTFTLSNLDERLREMQADCESAYRTLRDRLYEIRRNGTMMEALRTNGPSDVTVKNWAEDLKQES